MKLFAGNIIFVFLLNKFSSFAQESLDISKWNLSNLKYTRSIGAAVVEYYGRKTSKMSISVHLEYSHFAENHVMDFLSFAVTNSKLMTYEIFMSCSKGWQDATKEIISQHNLWYVDSYKAFGSLFLLAVNNAYGNDNLGEHFILMDTARSLDPEREVQLILEKSFEVNVVNVVVAVDAGDDVFALYSYDIFKPGRCRQVVVEQVNVFRNGNFENWQLFPYKFNNFNSCLLTMYIRNSSLFFRFNLTQDGSRIASIKGVEANMIKTMADKLNFSLYMYYNNHRNVVSNVYKNGTAVGLFRYLNEDKIDVILGYYHYPIRSHYFGESKSYAFMPLVIVMSEYKRNDLFGFWLFKPFSGETWLVLLVLILLAVILVQLAYYCLNKNVTWLDIIGFVLSNPRTLYIKSYATMISFMLCNLSIMILCALFGGRLYYAFNSKQISKITTVPELIKANYTFLITKRFDKDIIHSLHIPLKQIHFVEASNDFLIYEKMRSYPRNSATFTNYWDFQMYIDSNKCYSEFDMLPMIVILNQICAYMKSHSYLIEPLNRIIDSLEFAGILNKWLEDLTSIDKTNENNLAAKHQISNTPVPLTLDKFKTVFAGLIISHFLAILTFLAEVVVNDWRRFVQKFKKNQETKKNNLKQSKTLMENSKNVV